MIDSQRKPILAKKNHLFRWSWFWSRRLGRQPKLPHLGHKKPARTSHCLLRILVQRHNWDIFLLKWAKNGRYSQWHERIFVPKNLRGGCWQHLVSTGRRYVPHSRSYTRCFVPCFFKIALSVAELTPFSHLGAAISHRWTIICGVPSKISVTATSQRQLTLWRTILHMNEIIFHY